MEKLILTTIIIFIGFIQTGHPFPAEKEKNFSPIPSKFRNSENIFETDGRAESDFLSCPIRVSLPSGVDWIIDYSFNKGCGDLSSPIEFCQCMETMTKNVSKEEFESFLGKDYSEILEGIPLDGSKRDKEGKVKESWEEEGGRRFSDFRKVRKKFLEKHKDKSKEDVTFYLDKLYCEELNEEKEDLALIESNIETSSELLKLLFPEGFEKLDDLSDEELKKIVGSLRSMKFSNSPLLRKFLEEKYWSIVKKLMKNKEPPKVNRSKALSEIIYILGESKDSKGMNVLTQILEGDQGEGYRANEKYQFMIEQKRFRIAAATAVGFMARSPKNVDKLFNSFEKIINQGNENGAFKGLNFLGSIQIRLEESIAKLISPKRDKKDPKKFKRTKNLKRILDRYENETSTGKMAISLTLTKMFKGEVPEKMNKRIRKLLKNEYYNSIDALKKENIDKSIVNKGEMTLGNKMFGIVKVKLDFDKENRLTQGSQRNMALAVRKVKSAFRKLSPKDQADNPYLKEKENKVYSNILLNVIYREGLLANGETGKDDPVLKSRLKVREDKLIEDFKMETVPYKKASRFSRILGVGKIDKAMDLLLEKPLDNFVDKNGLPDLSFIKKGLNSFWDRTHPEKRKAIYTKLKSKVKSEDPNISFQALATLLSIDDKDFIQEVVNLSKSKNERDLIMADNLADYIWFEKNGVPPEIYSVINQNIEKSLKDIEVSELNKKSFNSIKLVNKTQNKAIEKVLKSPRFNILRDRLAKRGQNLIAVHMARKGNSEFLRSPPKNVFGKRIFAKLFDPAQALASRSNFVAPPATVSTTTTRKTSSTKAAMKSSSLTKSGIIRDSSSSRNATLNRKFSPNTVMPTGLKASSVASRSSKERKIPNISTSLNNSINKPLTGSLKNVLSQPKEELSKKNKETAKVVRPTVASPLSQSIAKGVPSSTLGTSSVTRSLTRNPSSTPPISNSFRGGNLAQVGGSSFAVPPSLRSGPSGVSNISKRKNTGTLLLTYDPGKSPIGMEDNNTLSLTKFAEDLSDQEILNLFSTRKSDELYIKNPDGSVSLIWRPEVATRRRPVVTEAPATPASSVSIISERPPQNKVKEIQPPKVKSSKDNSHIDSLYSRLKSLLNKSRKSTK